MNDINKEEMEEFIIEMEDLLAKAEDALLHSTELNFKAMYDVIFRSFHSIKGASGMLGFDILQNHFHRVENIFQGFKTKNNLSGHETNFFLSAIDASRDILKGKNVNFNYDIEAKNSEKTSEKILPDSSHEKKIDNGQSKKLIYVVDDEPEILEIISDILESGGYQVRTFSSPITVLEEMKNVLPAVVLSDVKMSPMTGTDLLRKVREQFSTLPFVFISGELRSDTLIAAIKDNVSDVIEKPFTPSIILNTIKNALEKQEILELLNKSIEIILFQFKDFYQYLLKEQKNSVAEILKQDVLALLKSQKKILKHS